MKKILIIGGLTSGFGGMETVFKKLYRLMNETQQYEVTFVLIGTPKEKHNFDWLVGIKHQFIGKAFPIQVIERHLATHQLANLLKKQKVAAIITYNSLGTLVAHQATQNTQNKPAIISWTHFSFDTFSPKHQKRIALANYHFAICDEIKEQMMEHGIQSDNIFTVFNPTTRNQSTITRPENQHTFLYIGRIQYQDQKNLQELFHSFAANQHKNTKLEIIGDGQPDDLKKLKDLARELNIENQITWHGWQKNAWEYVRGHIKTVTALVLTSTYEGFGMVLTEAISHGIFCISTNCPTGPDEIITEENGLLYTSGDTAMLTQLLNTACTTELPAHTLIKQSIEHLYDDQYIKHIQNILTKIAP